MSLSEDTLEECRKPTVSIDDFREAAKIWLVDDPEINPTGYLRTKRELGLFKVEASCKGM